MLDVLVLGSVSASADGIDYPLGGAKQQALLARLVLGRRRALTPERLIDDLWGEAPPRDPAHALQARISRLRSALPIDIELHDGGYRLDPTTIRTDAARFEQLCEHARSLLSDGEIEPAATALQRALELWRGPAFTGLPDVTTLRAEAVRLENLHSAALSDRIDLDLALGRGAAVIPELHALLEEHPFTERLWGQLMVALYCEGRVKEALDSFARARTAFSEHLGIEPSSELARSHTAILQEHPPESLLRIPRPSSAAGSRSASPGDSASPGGSDSGSGHAPRSPRAPHTTAPAQPARMLNSNHPDDLVALLHERGTLLLTGPAGIGKTHLLRALRTRFETPSCSARLIAATPLSRTVPLGVFVGTLPEKWTTPAALIDHFTRQRSSTVLLVDAIDQLDEASLFVVGQLIRNSRIPTVLACRSLDEAPDEIRSLYDSGDLVEAVVGPLTDVDADELITHMIGGALTPDARPRIFAAASGNPLHLREIITASIDDEQLVRTEHGWELHGSPAATPRLTRLTAERFTGLSDAELETAAKIAIAGELPVTAMHAAERRALARAGVVAYARTGWLRLTQSIDGEFLRARCSDALFRDLSHEVLRVLLDEERPTARRRAHILALDLDEAIDPDAMLAVAEHALGAFDERLALRAAEAVAQSEPHNPHAHRLAGLAASSMGMLEAVEPHFEAARRSATTPDEQVAVALAHAKHLGLRAYDATGALAVIDDALARVVDANSIETLQLDRVRWSFVAGQGSQAIGAPVDASDAGAALGLITLGVSGVITGPLDDAETALLRLRRIPRDILDLVPGGASLIALTEIMALSNSGDVVATRRRLRQMITAAEGRAPESLGTWEYALGLTELLSGDAEAAYSLAVAAAAHLEWRDTSGLLPAARTLAGAAAHATSRSSAAQREFAAVPRSAENDPKVGMLRAWAAAWCENAVGDTHGAARILLDAAHTLRLAQHNFFAGILAHCAVRTGELLDEAASLLDEVHRTAGGGLLALFARHAAATAAREHLELEAIARDAEELGADTTATDTWLALERELTPAHLSDAGDDPDRSARHRHHAATRLREATPTMALWALRT